MNYWYFSVNQKMTNLECILWILRLEHPCFKDLNVMTVNCLPFHSQGLHMLVFKSLHDQGS